MALVNYYLTDSESDSESDDEGDTPPVTFSFPTPVNFSVPPPGAAAVPPAAPLFFAVPTPVTAGPTAGVLQVCDLVTLLMILVMMSKIIFDRMELNQLQQQQDCQVTSGQLDQVKEVAVNTDI